MTTASEVYLPVQATGRNCHSVPGERRLLRAVVEDAFGIATGAGFVHGRTASGKDRIREEAREWFLDDSREMLSFLWFCTLLDLEPEPVRAAVRAAIARDQPAPAAAEPLR